MTQNRPFDHSNQWSLAYERFLHELGQRIQRLRVERHFTVQQLAKKSGISTAKPLHIEAGKTDFTMDTIVQFGE